LIYFIEVIDALETSKVNTEITYVVNIPDNFIPFKLTYLVFLVHDIHISEKLKITVIKIEINGCRLYIAL